MNKVFKELYDTLEEVVIDKWDRYQYNGKFVPRITEILSAMLHEDYLMRWSNAMGFKRKSYQSILDDSANIGTIAHGAIEDYLMKGIDYDYLSDERAYNCFLAFKDWWKIISANQYKILMQEEMMTCEYFGGTLDLLIEINGEIFLVDFKTSNHLSYKYILQLAAYRYLLRETKGIEIAGCIILRLDKFSAEFEEVMFHFQDAENLKLFEIAEYEFLALCYAYINRLYIENQFNNYNKG